MAPTDYLWLALLGLLAGASGGLLGIGGSIVMIPGMVMLFGADRQHLYQAAAMIVNFFVVAPAVIRHLQAKATLRPVTRLTIPSATLGSVAGVLISELAVFRGSGQGYLQVCLALFLGYAVLHNLVRLTAKNHLPDMSEDEASRLSKAAIIGLVGLPAGLLGGLLGVGGGLIAVPAQQIGLRIPLRRAIANSASTILWSSVIGAVVKNAMLAHHGFNVRQSCLLALCLGPPAILASYLTALRVHQWPVAIIRAAFVCLLLYCGGRLLLAGWAQALSDT